jgi:predicted RNase H-like HicB family nuclease
VRYTVVLVPDERDGGYVAYVPVIPGCVTQGETIEEAMAMARDAATGLLAIMAEDGEGEPIEAAGAFISSIEVARPELVTAGTTPRAEPATA